MWHGAPTGVASMQTAGQLRLRFRGYMGVSQNYGYHFGVPVIRTVVFWDLYWGSPYFGKLPYTSGVTEG